jgi:Leucine-rich repeat (LRR) protein
MEPWLSEYLKSERDSMFQNDTLALPNRRITKIDWIPDTKYTVNLSFNQLEVLPVLHSHILYLSLVNNRLRALPLLPRRLMYLNIEGNPLHELPELPKNLRVLRASYCALTSVPQFPNQMESIYLGFNELREIPDIPEGLDTLDIQENNIARLPYIPDSLRILRIERNPRLQRFVGKSLNEIRCLVKQEIAKERCAFIKEELMMVTWHPNRIENWLSIGYDIDDM